MNYLFWTQFTSLGKCKPCTVRPLQEIPGVRQQMTTFQWFLLHDILWFYYSNKTSLKVLSLGINYLLCSSILTFKSVDEILWPYHSNETSSAVLLHGTIYLVCSSNYWKGEFGFSVKCGFGHDSCNMCNLKHLPVGSLVWLCWRRPIVIRVWCATSVRSLEHNNKTFHKISLKHERLILKLMLELNIISCPQSDNTVQVSTLRHLNFTSRWTRSSGRNNVKPFESFGVLNFNYVVGFNRGFFRPMDQILVSLYVYGKLPTYPSPKPTLTLAPHLGQNVGLGEG